ncbi:MAG: hypothetical protein IMW98_05730 [Firmicutes bacterium]|nr:hypothetical protein [Bacillota bacterium]
MTASAGTSALAAPALATAWGGPGALAEAPLRRDEWERLRRREAAEREAEARRLETARKLERARRRALAGRAWRQFLGSALAIGFAFAVLVAVVARGYLVIEAGYRLDDLQAKVAAARWEEQRLEAAVGQAQSPAVVEAAAAARLSMAVPARMVKIAVHPAAPEAAAAPAGREATVALAPAPAPRERIDVWTALNAWLYSWFSGGAVEARTLP